MQFPNFDPVLVHIGPLAIRWYALAYIAGIVVGWRYGVALAKNLGLWRGARPTLDEPAIDDLVLWLTLAILVGGRLGYILFYNTPVIWTDPAEIFQPWHGGMSFHGAFIAVALVVVWFATKSLGVRPLKALSLAVQPWRRESWPGWLQALRVGDIVAPCVPIGLFFGRLANFINGELWGRPTHVPWAIVFCNARLYDPNINACPAGVLPRHPSQLYEAGLEGIVLFLILRYATHRLKWLPMRGAVTGLFMACYGLFRFSLEHVREPDRNMPVFPLGLTMGMMLSAPMIAVGLWLIWRSMQPQALAPDAQTDAIASTDGAYESPR